MKLYINIADKATDSEQLFEFIAISIQHTKHTHMYKYDNNTKMLTYKQFYQVVEQQWKNPSMSFPTHGYEFY